MTRSMAGSSISGIAYARGHQANRGLSSPPGIFPPDRAHLGFFARGIRRLAPQEKQPS
jgi:hypothetical protein